MNSCRLRESVLARAPLRCSWHIGAGHDGRRVGRPCHGRAARWPQVGGLLSFNVIFPSDQPDIARLLGCFAAAHLLWLV